VALNSLHYGEVPLRNWGLITKHLMIILGYDNDLPYVVRLTYDAVELPQDRFL